MTKTVDIFELADSATTRQCDIDPSIAVFAGIDGYADRWPDMSPDGTAAKEAFWNELRPQVEACRADDRNHDVAKRVLLEECRSYGAGTEAGSGNGSLNNIVSPWQGIRSSFEQIPRETEQDWLAVIARLEGVPTALSQYRQSLQAELDAGRAVARRQVLAAIEQGKEAAENSSFAMLSQKFAAAHPGNESVGQSLDDGIVAADGAYANMTSWLKSNYLPLATDGDGVGAEEYVGSTEQHLGSVIDPAATYDWGWSELHRLRAELASVSSEIEAGADPQRALHLLRTDPERAAGSADEFIQIMQQRQATALRSLEGDHFEVPEQIRRIDVKIEPPGGALGANYSPPSEDFSRNGTVWYPISKQTSFPLYSEITTAYHEGFPGHHLQVGWQVTMGDALSRFQRLLVWYPGSGEGWALYAEHLMGELGFLEKPDYRIGLLASQLLRTCRIVIDIGCHLGLAIPDDSRFHPGEKWSYELGKEMLETEAFIDPEIAESEIVRYLGWPGQAISYKLGEKVILDLRETFDAAGVSRRDFHRELLSVGSIGLDLTVDLVQPE